MVAGDTEAAGMGAIVMDTANIIMAITTIIAGTVFACLRIWRCWRPLPD